ncbi:LrgB family protein [Robbsia sp. Bb-Pol-6]|uniref:LrgB family protein n=1 Tax=Robbsia betulipollinis TaxID=2981849 RepID=A0ABT3ZK73_9BURK|nr:LrgB family protein [Robbsia betulipollinis]MCY0386929.1 LrgB family protein [Robbsia betulipollinis]
MSADPTPGLQWLGAFCLLSTILLYFAGKRLYARFPRIWLMPLVSVPLVLVVALLLTHVPYAVYLSDTRWLLWLLGPTTIAFALPIHEYRGVIRRHWLSLSLGVSVGIVSGVAGSFFLAKLLHLPPALQRAMAIRSVSTPFALAMSGPVGAAPDVVAILVIITGLVGMLIGKGLLVWLPMRTGIARGALFGAGAHGVGTATARSLGSEEGMIASLTMTIAGVVVVIAAPLIGWLLR